GLRPRAKETIRGLAQRLDRVSNSLCELKRQTEAADEAERRIAGLLQVSLRPVPVKGLSGLARLADHVARLGPVRRSWWDAARRKELQAALVRRQEEEAAAQALRLELTAKLSPQAFAAESAAIALQVSRFRWFLARWLPGWRAFKKRVSAWYVHGLPGTAPLLADVTKLAAYHQGTDYCRQVQELYAGDLLKDLEGKPDWAGT